MSKQLKPGALAPQSGIYDKIGPRGGITGKQVTAEKGEPLPPPPKSGMKYELAIKAKHGRR